jgi:hypothetical protein
MTDAAIVYVTKRSLTMTPPGWLIYHAPATRDYGTRTWCGLMIWSNDQREWQTVPIRRDIATCFARACEVCAPWMPEEEEL